MADFSPEKLITWAKEHKEIVIPAVVIGGGLGAYVLLKGGGLPSAGGTSTGTTPPQAGDPGGSNTAPGAPSGGADWGSAIGDLANQLTNSNTQNQNALQQLLAQVTGMISGLADQTNAALKNQADQTNAALNNAQQAYQQQAGMGDNGLGQLLMQLPLLQQQARNYNQSDITMPHFAASPYQIKSVIDTSRQGSLSVANSVQNVLNSFRGSSYQAKGVIDTSRQGSLNVANNVQNVLNSLRTSTAPATRISTPTAGFDPRRYLDNLRAQIGGGVRVPTSTPYLLLRNSGRSPLPISVRPRIAPNFTPNLSRFHFPSGLIGTINTQPGRGH